MERQEYSPLLADRAGATVSATDQTVGVFLPIAPPRSSEWLEALGLVPFAVPCHGLRWGETMT